MGVMVFFASFRARQAMQDMNYLLYLITGTAVATVMAAQYLWQMHAVDNLAKLAAFAVLLVFNLAWFGAPAAQWVPPTHSNAQKGGQRGATDEDIEEADL
jgi:hypothetical protein